MASSSNSQSEVWTKMPWSYKCFFRRPQSFANVIEADDEEHAVADDSWAW